MDYFNICQNSSTDAAWPFISYLCHFRDLKGELTEQERIILRWRPLGNQSEALKISRNRAKTDREFAAFLHLPFSQANSGILQLPVRINTSNSLGVPKIYNLTINSL